jgi:hypothetical protein
MFLVGIFTWWYGDGWQARIRITKNRLASSADYFSIGSLVTTLFNPYRQISAGRVEGPLAEQMRAFADRLVSRFIGAMVRSAIILAGSIFMLGQIIFGVIEVALWPIIPLFPVIGLIMMIVGWVPQWVV